MAHSKHSSDLLAARMRSATAGTKSPAPRVFASGKAPAKPNRNRRQEERKDAFKQGLLVSETGERIDVVLKNMTPSGARVDFFRGATTLDRHADLYIPTLGLKRKVLVVWKDQNSAGLKFET